MAVHSGRLPSADAKMASRMPPVARKKQDVTVTRILTRAGPTIRQSEMTNFRHSEAAGTHQPLNALVIILFKWGGKERKELLGFSFSGKKCLASIGRRLQPCMEMFLPPPAQELPAFARTRG